MLEKGFEYEGKTYKSIFRVAMDDELAKAYYGKGDAAHKINRIRKVLNEK